MSNIFSFAGVIGRDAEVRQIPSGSTVLNVAVANKVGWGDREQTMWIQVTVWGKRAEGNLSTYLLKGQHVFVSGELTQEEYQANDGTVKVSLRLNANIIDLIGKKSDGQQPAPQQQQPRQQQQSQPQNNQQSANNAQKQQYHDDFEDSIPF